MGALAAATPVQFLVPGFLEDDMIYTHCFERFGSLVFAFAFA
jgi:hypothetical protein